MPHLQAIVQVQVNQQLEDLLHHQAMQELEEAHLMHHLVEAHLMHQDSKQEVQSVPVLLITQVKFGLHKFHLKTFSNLWMIKVSGVAEAANKWMSLEPLNVLFVEPMLQ